MKWTLHCVVCGLPKGKYMHVFLEKRQLFFFLFFFISQIWETCKYQGNKEQLSLSHINRNWNWFPLIGEKEMFFIQVHSLFHRRSVVTACTTSRYLSIPIKWPSENHQWKAKCKWKVLTWGKVRMMERTDCCVAESERDNNVQWAEVQARAPQWNVLL